MEDCLFCKFVGGELKTNIVYEDEDFIIIKDIDPKAKNHFKFLAEATSEDGELIGRILRKIAALTDLLGLKNGYRLVINQGDDAGQSVPHLHIHILSGQKMGWQPA